MRGHVLEIKDSQIGDAAVVVVNGGDVEPRWECHGADDVGLFRHGVVDD